MLSARWLGPEGRGEFAIIILWPGIISAVGNLGIRDALVFFQARHYSSSELAGTALFFAVVQSVILIILGWLIIPLLTSGQDGNITHLSRQYLFYIPLNLLCLYPLGLLRGQVRIHRFNLIRGSLNFFYLVGLVILWWTNHLNVWSLAVALLVANAIVASLAWVSLVLRSGIKFTWNAALYRELLIYGVKNHIGTISSMLNVQLDQMLMAIFLTPLELGWYTVAVSVSGLAKLASSIFEKLLFPKTASAKTIEEQKQTISLSSRQNFTATLYIAGALMLGAPFLIPLVYSNAYTPAVVPALILILAGVFLSININWEAGLRGIKQPVLASRAELIGLLVTGFCLFIFLPILRILGASIASLISYSFTTFILFTQYSNLLSFRVRDLLMPIQYLKKVKF